MNTIPNHTKIRNLAIAMLFLFAGSCLDYTVTTKVNRDGSIFRQYTVAGDSADIFNGSLKVPSTKDWQITHSYRPKDPKDSTSEKSQYTYEASKTFANAADLAAWIKNDTSSGTIKPEISMKRRFRWFYTYYDYKEIYPMVFPFQKVPVDSFLSDMEQSVVMDDDRAVYSPAEKKLVWSKDSLSFDYTPADSAAIKDISAHCEDRFGHWIISSILQEYMDILSGNFSHDNTVIALLGKRSELETYLFNHVKLFDFNSKDITVPALVEISDSITGSKGISKIVEANPGIFESMNKKFNNLDNLDFDDSYHYVLQMPGKVFSTNALKIANSNLTWDIEKMYYFMKDYNMLAASRVSNPWMIFLSSLAALGLLYLVFIFRKK